MIVSDWKEQARSMIGCAVLAPSSHNTQPWFFQLSESAVDLFADRTRALPANDPEDRELAISCGCALTNLRIGAASAGLHVQVRLLPKPEEPDLLARMSLSGRERGQVLYFARNPLGLRHVTSAAHRVSWRPLPHHLPRRWPRGHLSA